MPLSDNLVSYWKLDEAGTANRVDSVGSNDLTATASAGNATGKLNSAVDLGNNATVVDQLLYIPDGSQSGLEANTFSVSFWYNTQGADYGFVNNRRLIAKEKIGVSPGWDVSLEINGGRIRMFSDYTGGSAVFSKGTFGLIPDTDSWHHVVATFNPSGNHTLYWDNMLEISASLGGGTMGNAADFSIGNRNNAGSGTGGEGWAGLIDEVAYWNRELTADDVALLYQSGSGNFYDNTLSNQFDLETQPPICWNYTAPYKGSDRRFKLSGPGAFPKSLNVPGNVDTSQGKMIDDGQLIDPDEYEV